MQVFIRVLPYVRRYPFLAFATLFCAVAGTLMVIVFPAVTQRIVDEVIGQHRPDRLVPLIAIGLAAFLAQNGLNSLRIIFNNHFEQRVIFDLRSELYAHIQKLPLHWFDNRSTGDIMTRLVEDVTNLERVLIDGIEQGSVAILQILVVSGLMLAYSPSLTAAALAPIPFLAGGALAYTLTARSRYRTQRKAVSALNSILHDNIAGIRQIKTYTSESREHARFDQASDKVRTATLTVMKAWAFYQPGMEFLSSLGLLIVAAFGTSQVLDGQLEIGALVAFFVLTRYLYEPVGRLHQLNQIFQSGRAAGERVFEIMDSAPEVDEGTNQPRKPVHGNVTYREVSFSYDPKLPVLHEVSLEARAGEMIALVGPTGAGKSTLVNLLVRFYEFTGGQITIDGTPLRDIPKDYLRDNIAVVTQESFLFNGTAAQNLRIGKPEATEEEMWQALRAANAEDFIRRLPEGLHAQLGERGVKLSVGEKQRLSIARALLKNPPILILDEATASVDTATERLIQEALDHLMENRTSFVIAHRLSTVRHANQILVLERGRITERGRHEELLARGGLYTDLCKNSLIEK
ncbi:MAG: ABC transporter ATP-binding protein [Verrucomicrobia bacterium]|nr:ABC transporter ATP-binding protein [Verrucomicrobiota bacterium]